MYKILATVLFTFSLLQFSFGQSSSEERLNRSVYNQIEYFFNLQEPDSIYNLANDDFKKQISGSQLSNILQQLFALGKIQEANIIKYADGIAGYKVDFKTETLLIVLGVDSLNRFHTLAFQPYTAPQEEKKEPVISQVEKINPLDFFVDSIARIHVQQGNAQSMAIAIVHRNNINRFFYGETASGNGTLPTENTLYEIGSITKTFTATLLADLAEKGLLNIDDTITKFLPDSLARNPDLQKITFKALANHTSGLPRLPTNLDKTPGYIANDPYAHYDQKALFAYLKNFKATREPETTYEYSNLGYGLLGELIAIISKKPFSQCIKDVITTPLHMSNTIDRADPKSQDIAKVYNSKGEEVSHWHFQALAGTGSLKSTLDDMLRYTIPQLTMPENELQRAMAATKLFTFFNPPNTDIGLAWHMQMVENMTCHIHTGGTGGSRSFVGLIPDEKSVVIILSNSELDVSATGMMIMEKLITMK